jgi:uncharacterized protein (TIGR03067 family)
MRRHAVAVVAVVSLMCGVGLSGAADEAKEEAVKKELQAFQGTWRLISRELDGKKASEEELKDRVVVFDAAGKVSARHGDKITFEAAWKIDPTKKPKAVDSTSTLGENKGKTNLGIYELEGDTLRVCLGPIGKERPTEFSSKPGSGNRLFRLEREKK